MAGSVGFEPTVNFHPLLISSQTQSTNSANYPLFIILGRDTFFYNFLNFLDERFYFWRGYPFVCGFFALVFGSFYSFIYCLKMVLLVGNDPTTRPL